MKKSMAALAVAPFLLGCRGSISGEEVKLDGPGGNVIEISEEAVKAPGVEITGAKVEFDLSEATKGLEGMQKAAE